MAVVKYCFLIFGIFHTSVLTPGVDAKTAHKIVGGSKVDIRGHPSVVAVENGWTRQTCGGCLVTIKHVITAAHCIVRNREGRDPYMYPMRFYNIKAGSSNRRDINKVWKGETCNVNIHRKFLQYPPTASGDIAVLTLCEPVKVGPCIHPAKLPEYQFDAGVSGVILGWGWANPDNGESIDELKKAAMTISYVDDDYFLARDREGVAFCNGDSGGPMLVGDCLAGVISNSPDCYGNSDGWYTNVYSFRTWILDVITFGGQSQFSSYVRTVNITSN